MLHKWFFSPWSNPLQSCPDWRHLITEWDVLYFSYVRIAPWLPYVCSASWKKLGSCVFQGLYWSPICFPCVWKKKYIVLEKVWKKSWILDPKICTNPVCWSYLDKTLHFLNSFDTWKLRATEPQVTFTQRIAGSMPVSVQFSCHCLEFRAETRTLDWCFSTWNSTQTGIKEFSSGKRKRNKYLL